MFEPEIDKYWRILNLRISKAEYYLEHDYPELTFFRTGDSADPIAEAKVLSHIGVKTRNELNSKLTLTLYNDAILNSSERLLRIYESESLFGRKRARSTSAYTELSGFCSLFGIVIDTDDEKQIREAFQRAMKRLYEISSVKTPIELFCNYKRNHALFGPGNIRLTETDFKIACRKSGLECVGTTTAEILVNLVADSEKIWKALKR
jgi:hypothetical protein